MMKRNLRRDYLRDLVTDARCAKRDGLAEYARQVGSQIKALWPTRHSTAVGRYGVPSVNPMDDIRTDMRRVLFLKP